MSVCADANITGTFLHFLDAQSSLKTSTKYTTKFRRWWLFVRVVFCPYTHADTAYMGVKQATFTFKACYDERHSTGLITATARLTPRLWLAYAARFQPVCFFAVRCTIVQSAVLRMHVVCPSLCPSVTLVDQDRISWKSWKLIAGTISPTSSLSVAQRPST